MLAFTLWNPAEQSTADGSTEGARARSTLMQGGGDEARAGALMGSAEAVYEGVFKEMPAGRHLCRMHARRLFLVRKRASYSTSMIVSVKMERKNGDGRQ